MQIGIIQSAVSADDLFGCDLPGDFGAGEGAGNTLVCCFDEGGILQNEAMRSENCRVLRALPRFGATGHGLNLQAGRVDGFLQPLRLCCRVLRMLHRWAWWQCPQPDQWAHGNAWRSTNTYPLAGIGETCLCRHHSLGQSLLSVALAKAAGQ